MWYTGCTMLNSPTPPLIHYTLWSRLTEIDRPVECVETWEQIVARFSNHARLARKDLASGFGPYRLEAPQSRCYKHPDGQPRDHAHRCDRCVAELTLAVFDADQGDDAAVAACRAKLTAAGVAQHWYSSYSHRYNRGPAYRLIIPLDRAVTPAAWPQFRQAVIERYAIPADPRQCAGRSHFYYAPSCPTDNYGLRPETFTGAGNPLRVSNFPGGARIATIQPLVVRDDYAAPTEPTEPVDLQPLLEILGRKLTKLKRNPAESYKAGLLDRLLRGVPLAENGGRNAALLAITGMLAYTLPGLSLGTYVRIMQPSLDAMKLDEGAAAAERMLLGAMRCKYLADKQDEAITDLWRAKIDSVRVVVR